MDKKELSKVNENHKEIEAIKDNITSTIATIDKLEKDIKLGNIFFRVEVSTYNGSIRKSYLGAPRLLGTKEIVRALKDSVSATKGYLHHLEKEFDRR